MSGASNFSVDSGLLIVTGGFPGYSVINKFGSNEDVDGPEDIWDGGGDYTGQPTSGFGTGQLVSTSASDAPAGIGARTIQIVGLDENFNTKNELVTLNGLTPVNTVGNFSRVFAANVQIAGTNSTNVGDITIRQTATPTNVFSVVGAGLGAARVSSYTVPAGHTAYLINYRAQVYCNTANQVKFAINRRSFGMSRLTQLAFTASTAFPIEVSLYGGLRLPEKTDIMIRAILVDKPNANITVGYDLVVVKN